MSDMVYVRNDVSEAGLRRVHVLRVGKQVDMEELLTALDVREDKLAARCVYEDEDTHVWHARLYWKVDGGPQTIDDGGAG